MSSRWHDDCEEIIPRFKSKVTLGQFGETERRVGETLDVHPKQIQDSKKQLLAKAEHIFGEGTTRAVIHAQVQ